MKLYNNNRTGYRVITSQGEILTFEEINAACRVVINFNNRTETTCYKNVGFGTETNTLYLKNSSCHIEYGNLTAQKVKAKMKDLVKQGWIDLSAVKIINNLSKIPTEEEYLYIEDSIFAEEQNWNTQEKESLIDKYMALVNKDEEIDEDLYYDETDIEY